MAVNTALRHAFACAVILGMAALTAAAESHALLLERALQLDGVGGDPAAAARIYEQIIEAEGPATRAKAEAALLLASQRMREARYTEAKALHLRVIRDFPEAHDLIPLAEDALLRVTALITREQVAANPAAPHRFGDLAVTLLSALENDEVERARTLLDHMERALAPMAAGADSAEIFVRLKSQSATVNAALKDGGAKSALAALRGSAEFETFLNRSFPADPQDVLAPAWRLKDRLSRALAARDAHAAETASALENYLAPVAVLPFGQREGSLARLIVAAARDIRELAAAGDFAAARARLDVLDGERHQQFPTMRIVSPSPVRLPEAAVAAGWIVVFRAELARRELNKRGDAVAMDHIQEAIKAAQVALALTTDRAVANHIELQIVALHDAHRDVLRNIPVLAQTALKRVTSQ